MQVKQTKRIFTLKVPDGVEEMMVREFVRDIEGTDHAQDKIIKVPKYRVKTVGYICGMHLDRKPDMVTEEYVLSQEAAGTTVLETQDVVVYVELPDLPAPAPEVHEPSNA